MATITYTLTPPTPSTGYIANASGNFVAALPATGDPLGTITVTPAWSRTGTFSPSTVALTNAARSGTFTLTPTAVIGLGTVTTTNSTTGTVVIVDPAGATYTSGSMVYTLVTPTTPSGGIDAASGNFTVTLAAGENPGGTITVTPAATIGTVTATDGTFSPATVAVSNAVRSAVFTYTPTVPGARGISTTTNSALFANPVKVVYTCLGQKTTAQTVFKNISGGTMTLSFLRKPAIANNATFTFSGGLADLVRVTGGHRNTRYYDAVMNMIYKGQLAVVATPDVVIRDTVTGAVKTLTAASGTLGVTDPSWGAETVS